MILSKNTMKHRLAANSQRLKTCGKLKAVIFF
jgi:hypothetical protein